MSFLRRSEAARSTLPPHVGYSVRLDWADGSHSFAGYVRNLTPAERSCDAIVRYWQRGPVRPTNYEIVVISRHDWKLHARRGQCRAPDCEPHGQLGAGSAL
jgi:hypothetical protein